jgi:phage shock protein C
MMLETPSRQLYKDKIGGKWLGVGAGIANYLEVDVKLIRWFFLISWLFWPWSFLIYLWLALILDDNPHTLAVNDSATQFIDDVELKLAAIEQQLYLTEQMVKQIESYVVSDEFELKRKRWD